MSQPPLNPIALEQTGYKVYRDMVHGMFSNAGAVRIDHILGLFRLWWIPEGKKAMDGTYVHYDSDIMLGILALEASRAGGVVVGEDLGVVPAYVSSRCRARHSRLRCGMVRAVRRRIPCAEGLASVCVGIRQHARFASGSRLLGVRACQIA